MLKDIFFFELKYRIKRPATWAYFGILFIFGWLIAANGGNDGGSEKAFANSAYEVTSFIMIISIFSTVIASAVMGVPVYRDIEHGVKNYYFTYPLNERSYLLGRYLGSFVILMLISTGIVFGMIVGYAMGPGMGWEEAERFGPLRLGDYWHATTHFLWPNLLFTGTIFFCLVALTRKILVAYVGSVLFFIGYLVAITLAADLENKEMAALIDPFGYTAWDELTKYWTPTEQNELRQPLTGNYLINRILWPALSILLLIFTIIKFKFSNFIAGSSRRRKKKEEETLDTHNTYGDRTPIPAVQQHFGSSFALGNLFSQAWIEFKSVVRDPYFIGIILGGVLFLFLDGWFGNTTYGTPSLPMTYYMIEAKNGNYIIFVMIILVFYTGEVVHRDRTVGFDQIADALPVPNWSIYLGKFFTMALIAFLLASMVWVVGIFSQTIQGYFNYELGKYFTDLYILTFPMYLSLTILAFFVHVLVNKKFLGHVIAIAIYVLMFSIPNFADIDFNMFIYANRPGYLISDMNGFGHFIPAVTWFNVYWLALGGMMIVIGSQLWSRGTDTAWRTRIQQFNDRWSMRPMLVLLGFLAIFLWTGFTIYHNVTVKNDYVSIDKTRQQQANYEKDLSKYKRIYQPKIYDVKYEVDLYPEQRTTRAKAIYQITNKSPQPIDSLHLNFSFSPKRGTLTVFEIGGVEPAIMYNDSIYQYQIRSLDPPLMPGDSTSMVMEIDYGYEGFPNEGFQRDLLYNGTFLSSDLFPSFGYNFQAELTSDLQRKKHGLEIKEYIAPPHTDSLGLRNLLFGDDADFVSFEAIISTAPDQIAIAPGQLQKEWEENGRKYYHYKNNGLIQNFFNISSARYAVEEKDWKGSRGETVKIQIFHHADHAYNLDRYFASVEASLDYFTNNFSPFQFEQMRILEFPRYASFAQSFPNTVPYSESFGWVADFSDPDDTDYSFYVTSHEVAHQWWGHQIAPSATRGANQISETMAQYSAMMVLKERYGEAVMPKFLKYELDSYLRGRANESKFEKTLLDNDTQSYVWYRKGSNIMYTLQDYLTEDTLNLAFQRFLDDYALKNQPPYATSYDWYGYIKEVTPDSLQYFLEESFERITMYENKVVEVTSKANNTGTYDVTLQVEVKKLTYDGDGIVIDEPQEASLIEIGVFGPDGTNEYGMTATTPLYLKKMWLTPGIHEIKCTVKEAPLRAGIDPYHKLIDRISDDNITGVDVL